ncbi:hypothetical protein AB0N62_43080 [Streptomyces sp. NPDC093982]|uniref:hypothetical protein n=1 Tax=Streptomyces sp. NPDC093982 TaxID=3155077 RepID=UPI00342BDD75
MATIHTVRKNLLERLALYRRQAEIAEIAAQRAGLYRPQLLFTPPVLAALKSGLAAVQPAHQMNQSWAVHQQQLLRAASLFNQVGWPFAITHQMVQRTTDVLQSLDEERYSGLRSQDQKLTSEDQARVRSMVDALAPLVTGMPPDEARGLLVDLVAIGLFAPCTEAVDEIDDDDEAAEVLIRGLELAFSAALFAGALWDQR